MLHEKCRKEEKNPLSGLTAASILGSEESGLVAERETQNHVLQRHVTRKTMLVMEKSFTTCRKILRSEEI